MPRSKLHHAEISERSVGVGDFVVSIGQELEVQSFLGAELFVRVDAIEAHTQHNGVAIGVPRLIDLKVVGFARAAWRLIFRIEIKDNPFSAVVCEADGGAFL